MKFLEKFNTIFLLAGVGLLLLAFITLGWVPAMMTDGVRVARVLPSEIPEDFLKYYISTGGAVKEYPYDGEVPADHDKPLFASVDEYRDALFRGRDIYIKEACWHCHSQYVRPAGNEALRYGPESTPEEYQNELNLPQLFGTRRVGPDLIRLHGKYANDWHFVHLYNPRDVVPLSVMPSYPWYFNADKSPKPDAAALVAYLQWLGSWLPDQGSNLYDTRQ